MTDGVLQVQFTRRNFHTTLRKIQVQGWVEEGVENFGHPTQSIQMVMGHGPIILIFEKGGDGSQSNPCRNNKQYKKELSIMNRILIHRL